MVSSKFDNSEDFVKEADDKPDDRHNDYGGDQCHNQVDNSWDQFDNAIKDFPHMYRKKCLSIPLTTQCT